MLLFVGSIFTAITSAQGIFLKGSEMNSCLETAMWHKIDAGV